MNEKRKFFILLGLLLASLVLLWLANSAASTVIFN
jgi:hypothetical protein